MPSVSIRAIELEYMACCMIIEITFFSEMSAERITCLIDVSVYTQLAPVARNTPSSQAENHIVRLAQKMNRRILSLARWIRVVSAASGSFSAATMRRIQAANGCMTGPRYSCALDAYFVI